MKLRTPLTVLVLSLSLIAGSPTTMFAQRTAPPANPLYEQIADDVFLQEIGHKISTDGPVTDIVANGEQVYALIAGQVFLVSDASLEPIADAPSEVTRLFALAGRIWCVTADATYLLRTGTATRVLDEPAVDMCMHLAGIHAATSTDIYRFTDGEFKSVQPEGGWLSSNTTMIMEDGIQILADPVRLGPIRGMVSYSGTLHLLRPDGIVLLEGPVLQSEPVDWGSLPSPVHRDVLTHGSRLVVATDRGLGVLRGAALTSVQGDDGLPFEDTTCLATGFARDLWIGTTGGAIRQLDGEFHFFGADHWLLDNHVHAIAVVDATKSVFVATDRGIGVIRYEPYTLRKKASVFEKSVAARGHKRLGFVHKLYWSDPDQKWLREVSDNDGGHSSHYLGAMAFKYAVTGDVAAQQEAIDTFEALVWLQTVTGTDGFFARAIWADGIDQGKRSTRGSGGLPAKWYEAAEGPWLWKGDTSSDEVNAHFYAVALFHDLVAEGPQKQRAAEHLARIAKHIIDNGWVLRDMDGQPTRWGRWDPDYLLRPYGFEARGLNGMEAQAYMWTAYKLTGEKTFRQGLDQLLDWRYHTYTVREKMTFPPESVVPWDDELAFRCFHPMLTYCDEPYLRSIYLRALTRHWEVMRMQKVPYYNFMYGGLTGNDCEARQAVEHLRAWSLETVSHSYRNSHRADLQVEPGYTPYMGGTRAISPRETGSMWGSRSALHYDGGGGGRIITPPIGWLEDYWMGRYYGMIAAPTVTEPALLEADVPDTTGAAAYAGPPRPPLQ